MALIELISPEVVKVPLTARTKLEVLRELAEVLHAAGRVSEVEPLYLALAERESLGSTGLDGGIAVPHCRTDAVRGIVAAVGVSPDGVDFGSLDGGRSRLFFLLIAPPSETASHIAALAEIARIARSKTLCSSLVAAGDAGEVARLLREASIGAG